MEFTTEGLSPDKIALISMISPYLDSRGTGFSFKLMGKKTLPQKDYWRFLQERTDVHALGKFFKKITALRPNERPEHKAFREMKGEPITMGPWARNDVEVAEVLTKTTASLQTTEGALAYFNTPVFDGSKGYDYFVRNYFRIFSGRSNDLVANYPPEYAAEHGVNPVQHVSFEMIDFISKDAICFLSEIESEVETTFKAHTHEVKDQHGKAVTFSSSYAPTVTKKVKTPVWHIFTRDMIARLYFVEKNGRKELMAQEVAAFQMRDIPAYQNGGTPTDMDFVHGSFFEAAIGQGNLALDAQSDSEFSRTSIAYPHIAMDAEPCPMANAPVKSCMNGQYIEVSAETGAETKHTCGTCKGSGKVIHLSQSRIHLRSPGNAIDGAASNRPMIEFYSPPVDILKLGSDAWKYYFAQYKAALCLYDKEGAGTESGTAIGLQMAPRRAQMLQIGPVVFGNIEKTLRAIQLYISPGTDPAITKVIEPPQYGIATEETALNFIMASYAKNGTPAIRREQIHAFFQSYVGAQSPSRTAYRILEMLDNFAYHTEEEKITLFEKGGMTKEQLLISTSGYLRILRLVANDPTIDPDKAVEQVTADIKAEMAAIQSTENQPNVT